jgi:HEAT repeat protein
MLCLSSGTGSAHIVPASYMVARCPEVADAQAMAAGNVAWLAALTDEQIRAGGWLYPGPRLRAYLDAAVRAAQVHPWVIPEITPPPLTSVYVHQKAKVSEGSRLRARLLAADDSVRFPAEVIFQDQHSCILLAGPGAGKSSLLRAGLTASASQWQQGEPGTEVPVRVQAADLARAVRLPEAIADSVRADLGSAGIVESWPAEFFASEPLRGVRWLVLIDGVDEITDRRQRRDFMAKITGLTQSKAASPYRFVLATRPLADGELPEAAGWTELPYELQAFEVDQLPEFASAWFAAMRLPEPRRAAERFIAKVDQSRMTGLARVPLMATMLCQLHALDPDGPIPSNRFRAYEMFVELLQARQVTSTRPGISDASGTYDQLKAALSRYGPAAEAAAGWLADRSADLITRLAVARHDDDSVLAVDLIADWTSSGRPQQVPAGIWRSVLTELLRRSSLLTERDGDFVFVHQTIAEFLTARHIAADSNASSAAFRHVFGQWARPRPWLGRRWLRPPDEDTSFLGFLIDAWQSKPALPRELVRLVTHGGDDGLGFIGDIAEEGTVFSAETAAALTTALTAVAAKANTAEGSDLEAAWALTDIDPTRGNDLLYAIAIRPFAHLRLARPKIALPHLSADDRDINRIMRQADERNLYFYRELAAQTLVTNGDPRGADAFAAIASDNSGTAGTHTSRASAAQRLAQLSDPRAKDLLSALATSASIERTARTQAARALANIGDRQGIEVLTALTADPATSDSDRLNAAKELADLGDPIGRSTLVAMAISGTVKENVRIAAARALAGTGDGRGAEVLAALTADPAASESDRLNAAKELADLGDPRGISSLGLLIASPKMPGWKSREALGALTEMAAPSTAEMLASLAASPETPARMKREAAEALADIGDPRATGLLAGIASDPALAQVDHEDAITRQVMHKVRIRDPEYRDGLARKAADATKGIHERFEAAQNLTRNGDPRGPDLLNAIMADPAVGTTLRREASADLADFRLDRNGLALFTARALRYLGGPDDD